MQNRTLAVCTALLALSLNAAATEVCEQHPGMLLCGEGTVDAINRLGSVSLDGTTVTGTVKVLGNLNAQRASLNAISIRGETHLTHSVIQKDLHITGNFYTDNSEINSITDMTGNCFSVHSQFNATTRLVGTLDADHSTFNGALTLIGTLTARHTQFTAPIAINSTRITLNNSTTGDITVIKPGDNRKQTIYLKDGSSTGNITFESQQGTVLIDAHSKINGKVQGGKIITG